MIQSSKENFAPLTWWIDGSGAGGVVFSETKSILLDGVIEYLKAPNKTVGDLSSTDVFVIDIWLKYNSAAFFKNVCGKRSVTTNKDGWALQVPTNSITFNAHNGSSFLTVNGPGLTINEWVHVAVRSNGDGTYDFFKNGVKSAGAVSGSAVGAWGHGVFELCIGSDGPGTTQTFPGNQGHFGLWNAALTDSQILEFSGSMLDRSALSFYAANAVIWTRGGNDPTDSTDSGAGGTITDQVASLEWLAIDTEAEDIVEDAPS